MKILYLTDGINAVFQSQVLGLMNEIANNESIDNIILCVGVRDLATIPKFKFVHPKIELLFFKSYPMYPLFNTLTKRSILNCFKKIKNLKDFVIHVRIEFLASLIFDHLEMDFGHRPKMLVDIRGVLIEEVKEYGRYNRFLKILKLLRYRNNVTKLLNKVPSINVVSKALRDYVKSTYSVEHDRITVIPTIAGNNFYYKPKKGNLIREELGITNEEKLYVFSSGSSQKWQKIDELIEIAKNTKIKVLILTKDNIEHPNIISRFVDYELVPDYLAAADIGIIIREDSIVNYVSSPIKFCEYVASGLPVYCIGDIKTISDFKLICTNSQTIQITDEFLIQQNLLFTNAQRKELSDKAIETFGIKAISLRYINEYRNIET